MKITFLSNNLSSNGLARAYILAEMLSLDHDVEILGFDLGGGIWPPLQKGRIKITPIMMNERTGFAAPIKKMLGLISGDVIYSVKPLPLSFGVGLIKKFLSGKPLVLDIDDDTDAFRGGRKPFYNIFNPSSQLYFSLIKKLLFMADKLTTVSDFLRKKYGSRGTMIPHGRDETIFDPALYDKDEQKRKFGLEGLKTIVFLGQAMKHKGIDDLAQAIRLIGDKKIKLVLAGVPNDKTAELMKNHPDVVSKLDIAVGFFDVPSVIAASDLVVLPQRKNLKSLGQVPAKLIDAMAMAKPIISTNISDIPKILEGCGIIVEPDNVSQLSQAVASVFQNYDRAEKMGLRARRKFLECYSYKAVRNTFNDLIMSLEGK
jgi:glycosyltransferase involved in cell wall biosynthesis